MKLDIKDIAHKILVTLVGIALVLAVAYEVSKALTFLVTWIWGDVSLQLMCWFSIMFCIFAFLFAVYLVDYNSKKKAADESKKDGEQ